MVRDGGVEEGGADMCDRYRGQGGTGGRDQRQELFTMVNDHSPRRERQRRK